MNLKHLTDGQLKIDTQNLVQNERSLLTQILYHLKEIESRKLYSSFGYTSLFDYACRELKYSSDQAYRRIQAMRLLKEIPEVAQKIDSGDLSLSNINQAQKFFKEASVVSKDQKVEVLKKLIHKSVRDGQKIILSLAPECPLPLETKKQVSTQHSHVSFNMSDQLEHKINLIKSLLGPKSYNLSMAELIETIADLANEKLTEKKFGRKNMNLNINMSSNTNIHPNTELKLNTRSNTISKENKLSPYENYLHIADDIPFQKRISTLNVQGDFGLSGVKESRRYLPKKLKYHIWHRDNHKCKKCSSNVNLHIDHIISLSLGGPTREDNLRLLCFNCNQRNRIEARL